MFYDQFVNAAEFMFQQETQGICHFPMEKKTSDAQITFDVTATDDNLFDIDLTPTLTADKIPALPEIDVAQLDNPVWAKLDLESDTPSYFKKQLNMLSVGDSFRLGESFRTQDKRFSFDSCLPSPSAI